MHQDHALDSWITIIWMKFAVHTPYEVCWIYAVWTLAYLILDELFEHILIIICWCLDLYGYQSQWSVTFNVLSTNIFLRLTVFISQ